MRSPVDRFNVNHRQEFDSIRVMNSDDGMTVEIDITHGSMWYPIRLNKAQWRRWRKAVDKAFESVEDDGGHDDSFSDGFRAGYQAGAQQNEAHDETL